MPLAGPDPMKAHARTPRILAGALAALAATVHAGAVDLRDFGLLRRGMSEAEVLYRLGPYDHETVHHDHHHHVVRRTWYYIPDGSYSGDWITTIHFDASGRVRSLERTRP